MQVRVVGTSYKQTSVAGREKLAAGGEASIELLERARVELGARECVFLPTCNRFEAYVVAPEHSCSAAAARRLFCGVGGDEELLSLESVYCHSGREAVEHLFEVASGLDSMVLGEHEILGQVKSALTQALSASHAGPVLSRLFQHAVKTGKRARRETAISSGVFSMGQCAARMAQSVVGELQGKQLLILGSGRIAKTAAKHMAAMGVAPILVFSRTREKAEALAELLGGRTIAREQLREALRNSDIVLGCAAAPHSIIEHAQIREAIKARGGRVLAIIDLGVPRNVEPAVGTLAGVSLFNIDDVEAVVAVNSRGREAEVERVRAIIAEEADGFLRSALATNRTELIARLRRRAEKLRQECLEHAARRRLTEDDLALFDYLTDLLVRKLLHRPTVALREGLSDELEDSVDVDAIVARLFGLDRGGESGCRPDSGEGPDAMRGNQQHPTRRAR